MKHEKLTNRLLDLLETASRKSSQSGHVTATEMVAELIGAAFQFDPALTASVLATRNYHVNNATAALTAGEVTRRVVVPRNRAARSVLTDALVTAAAECVTFGLEHQPHTMVVQFKDDGTRDFIRVYGGGDKALALLREAFGEMGIKAGDRFRVDIDEDGDGFSVEAWKKEGKKPPKIAVDTSKMVEGLRVAGQQFLAYRDAHLAKGGASKAAVNGEMATMCFAAAGDAPDTEPSGYMLGLFPVASSVSGMEYAIDALVQNAYEHDMSHDDIMQALITNLKNIGIDHGWPKEVRLVADVGLGSPMISLERDAESKPPRPRPLQERVDIDSALLGMADDADQVEVDYPNTAKRIRDTAELLERFFSAGGTPDLVSHIQAKAMACRKRDMSDTANVLEALAEDIGKDLVPLSGLDPESALRAFYDEVHARNVTAGWWTDPATGEPKARSLAELFTLVVTELAEAFQAYVENTADDKLPHLHGLGVEIGDVQIRLADIAGALRAGRIVSFSGDNVNPGAHAFNRIRHIAMEYDAIRKTPEAIGNPETGEPLAPQDVAAAVFEKMEYNATREDHKMENRVKPGGKLT